MHKLINVFAATAILSLSSSAFAATSSNTVRFMGEVSEQTCDINFNGSSSSPVILLPTVSSSQLDTSGTTTGDTPFTVTLSGCGGAQTANAAIVFVANDVDGTNLKNTATTSPATNVAIQLMEGSNALDFVGNKAQTGTKAVDSTNPTATYDLAARYYATGQATSGAVEAQAQFAVTYQ
ncbi:MULTISPECIES: fimbrial protein [Kosakonia]|uniref:fimbrial protein n=1 Tax=Kosakonia TaxID=1330547 RepID=UPI00201DAEA6|nr:MULTISPECIES: fimbrial protein [Kosakonia]MCL6743337.1 type 1 fimbrial protein [Kosakonia sp. R1.Fl]MDZ7324233.1 type 1 fimbrial protein [Kosakonia sacchari]